MNKKLIITCVVLALVLCGVAFGLDVTLRDTTSDFNGVLIEDNATFGNASGAVLDTPTNSYLRVGDAGTTSRSMNNNDDLFVSGRLEVDSVAYMDGNVIFAGGYAETNDNIEFYYGTGEDSTLVYRTSQTPHSLMMGLSVQSNGFVIAELVDLSVDFGQPLKDNPTVFIQSANSSDGDEALSLEHDQTDARAVSLQGDFRLSAAENVAVDGDVTIGDPDNYLLATLSSNGTNILLEGKDTALDFMLLPYAGAITHVGDAGSTDHSLNANDDLLVSGKLEVDGITYFDGGMYLSDSVPMYFGSSNDAFLWYSVTYQTPDTLHLGVGSDTNALIISERGDSQFNFAHAQQTNPTVYIHSKNQTTTEWVGLSHNTTMAIINTGAGDIYLDPIGNDIRIPTDTNITWDNGAKIWVNSTCIVLSSPAGTGVSAICD